MILVFGGSQRPTGFVKWGGWGSNPRPADYEKYGPAHRVHYLHGYHDVMPPMALIALFAPMARSTNRSTAKRRLPPVLLPCVTPLEAPRPRPRERIATLGPRGVARLILLPDERRGVG
jgi:hypothetical protein